MADSAACSLEQPLEAAGLQSQTSSKDYLDLPVVLLSSMFAHRPPTIFFDYPDYCGVSRSKSGDKKKLKLALAEDPKAMWIIKPVNASCGRGIRLVSGASVAAAGGSAAASSMSTALPGGSKRYVAQRYVQHPYLINNTKFDLRVYCCVTSLDPLRIYVYNEGLVRFATQQYSTSNSEQGNRFAHLTNYSVNKKADGFNKNTSADQDASGSKWSLSALLRHLASTGEDAAGLMRGIQALCVKTILCCEPEVTTLAHSAFRGGNSMAGTGTPCFEVYGVDVILDKQLHPWLLEVNVSPSLSSSSPMDKRIKTMLMTDTFHMAGFVPFDPAKAAKLEESQRRERLLGQGTAPSSGWGNLATRAQAADLASMQVQHLSAQDISVICETEDEFARRGNFVRVFPTQSSAAKFGHLFETPRYNNLLLDMWLGKWKAQLGESSAGPRELQPVGARPVSGETCSPSPSPSPSAASSSADGPPKIPVTVAAAVHARAEKRASSRRRPPSAASTASRASTQRGSPSQRSRPSSVQSSAASQRLADAARARKVSTASRIEQRFAMYRSAVPSVGGNRDRPSSAVPTLKIGVKQHHKREHGSKSAPTSARGPSKESGHVTSRAAGGAAAAIRSQRALHQGHDQSHRARQRAAPPLYRYQSQLQRAANVTPAAAPVTAAMLAGTSSMYTSRAAAASQLGANPTHTSGGGVSVSLPSAFRAGLAPHEAPVKPMGVAAAQAAPRRGRFTAPPASPIAANWSSDEEAPARPAQASTSWYRGHLVRAKSGGVAFR